jgi:release factor glutamine methyltransferase
VGEARRVLARAFCDAGIASPELDARLLVGHALGLDHSGLAEQAKRPLREDQARRIGLLAERRIAREPVARIIGRKEFWSLELLVTPDVLVPRPETETLVEAALELVRSETDQNLRIADLGTGSGALLLALLIEFERAGGIGTDASPAALSVARENSERLGLTLRASFVACDFGEALKGEFDLVVTNPPYIAAQDWQQLDPEVRDHDPKLSLDGGRTGLAAYRRIAEDAARLLAPDAHLIVELGAGMAKPVDQIFSDAGLVNCGTRSDLLGIPRAMILRRSYETCRSVAKTTWIIEQERLALAKGSTR